MAMEFKVGDLVATEKWTPYGDIPCLGMVVEKTKNLCRIDWYGFHVDLPLYDKHSMVIFRDNYFALRKKLNL